MTAIRLNRRMVLEEQNRAPDGAGGYAESWAALGEVWADVRARSGRERFGDAVTVSTVPYHILVRAAAPGSPSRPEAGQRLREGGRVFAILAVTERDAEGRYLTCFAREEVPA